MPSVSSSTSRWASSEVRGVVMTRVLMEGLRGESDVDLGVVVVVVLAICIVRRKTGVVVLA